MALARRGWAQAAADGVPPPELDGVVRAAMEKHRVPGVAVVGIAGRGVAWEAYFGVREAGRPEPVNAETIFEVASMTKPTAAFAALRLVEQGRLDPDRPLRDYLDRPYLPGEPLHLKITARMALAHTTGFPNWRKGGWEAGGPVAPASEPGTKYSYSGEGYTYLQAVLERIVGEAIGPYLERTLLRPVGAPTARYTWQDAWGLRAAAGHLADGRVNAQRTLYRRANVAFSLYCPAREYAAFVVEMLQPDRTGAHSLGAAARAAMLAPTTRIPPSGPPLPRRDGSMPRSSHYGLGWAIDELARDRRIRHSGSNGSGFRSYTEFYPARGTGIVICTNAAGGTEVWREAIRRCGEP